LTAHIDWLQTPLQIHHAVDDAVVNIGYARDLAAVLEATGKPFELHEYASGGHNLQSPAFEEAMQRTIEFYRSHL
jgi:predicted esterase